MLESGGEDEKKSTLWTTNWEMW